MLRQPLARIFTDLVEAFGYDHPELHYAIEPRESANRASVLLFRQSDGMAVRADVDGRCILVAQRGATTPFRISWWARPRTYHKIAWQAWASILNRAGEQRARPALEPPQCVVTITNELA